MFRIVFGCCLFSFGFGSLALPFWFGLIRFTFLHIPNVCTLLMFLIEKFRDLLESSSTCFSFVVDFAGGSMRFWDAVGESSTELSRRDVLKMKKFNSGTGWNSMISRIEMSKGWNVQWWKCPKCPKVEMPEGRKVERSKNSKLEISRVE